MDRSRDEPRYGVTLSRVDAEWYSGRDGSRMHYSSTVVQYYGHGVDPQHHVDAAPRGPYIAGPQASTSRDESLPPSPLCVFPSGEAITHEIQDAIKEVASRQARLLVAIDMSETNRTTGERSFGGRCLHTIGTDELNPYQKALHAVSRVVYFEERIPCYVFGNTATEIFPAGLHSTESCVGMAEVLEVYAVHALSHDVVESESELASVVNVAVEIVEESETEEQYVLVIISDGQELGLNEETIEAVESSNCTTLSVVLIGVGDGPWDEMRAFAASLSSRGVSNFQFIGLTVARGRRSDVPEDPPSSSTPASDVADDSECQICRSEQNEVAFQCWHQTCSDCASRLEECPFCKEVITMRFRI